MSTALDRATRNATVLAWWAACSFPFKCSARALRAQELGCPTIELGDVDELFPQDEDTIEWLAVTYPHIIAGWVEDHS